MDGPDHQPDDAALRSARLVASLGLERADAAWTDSWRQAAADLPDSGRISSADALARAMAAYPEARIHLYGKQWRAGRKLGHVTMTVGRGQEVADVVEQARGAVAVLRGDA